MNRPADADLHPMRANPVLWLNWLLLSTCVIAGFVTFTIAIRSADRALPSSYHWEGVQLEADFARAREAMRLGLHLRLDIAAGECVARLAGGMTSATDLVVAFASGTSPDRDHTARLARAADGEYRGDCGTPGAGRWRVTLEDAARTWRIRTRAEGPLRSVELRARDPGGAG